MTNPTSMIEKIARALCQKAIELKGMTPLTDEEWTEMWADPKQRQDSTECVKAAISAMREPSEVMVIAGWNLTRISGTESGCYSDHHATPEESWQAMIDAILTEDNEK